MAAVSCAAPGLVALLFLAGTACETPTYHRLFAEPDGGYLVIGNAAGASGGDAGDDGLGTGGEGVLEGSGGVGGPLTTGGASGSSTGGGRTTTIPPGTGGMADTGGVAAGGNGGGASSGGGPGPGNGSGGLEAVGSGGSPIAGGSGGLRGTGGAGSGGSTMGSGGGNMSGTGGSSSGGASADSARYSFEQSTQSWGAPSGSAAFTSVTSSTAAHFAGQSSLAGTISTDATRKFELAIALTTPSPGPGVGVTFHVLVPVGAPIAWVQPYVKTGAPGYTWTGVIVSPPSLKSGEWNTIAVAVPAGSAAIRELGVQLNVTAAWTGTVYVDSVTW